MLSGHRWRSDERSVPGCWMTKELAVAGPSHPAGAGQVAVVDISGALGFQSRVDAEQDIDRFGPFRTVIGGVKQAHVELYMRPIVFGQHVANRRDVVEGHDRRCHVGCRHISQMVSTAR